MICDRIRVAFVLFGLFSFSPSAAALQDPDPELGPVPIELPGMVDEAQEEMLQLFRDIEQNLKKVDILLSDAGAGDTQGLRGVEEAGIGRLLEDTRDRSQQVLEDIDRLLEIAEQMGQQSSSGQPGEPQNQSGGSSGAQGSNTSGRGTQTTRREETPETPGEESASQSPEGGEHPDGQQPGE